MFAKDYGYMKTDIYDVLCAKYDEKGAKFITI
jgi:hypothetical protein